MELDEEHAGTTDLLDEQVDRGVTIAHISVLDKSDISKVIKNQLSPKISCLSVEYKNDELDCCAMDWKIFEHCERQTGGLHGHGGDDCHLGGAEDRGEQVERRGSPAQNLIAC